MIVLVCGGREYCNWAKVRNELDSINSKTPISRLIQGGAKGADFLAKAWAQYRGIDCWEFKANWKDFGKKAGAMRNAKMLKDGSPDLVIAFPGGNGTADMINKARAAGVETRVIEHD